MTPKLESSGGLLARLVAMEQTLAKQDGLCKQHEDVSILARQELEALQTARMQQQQEISTLTIKVTQLEQTCMTLQAKLADISALIYGSDSKPEAQVNKPEEDDNVVTSSEKSEAEEAVSTISKKRRRYSEVPEAEKKANVEKLRTIFLTAKDPNTSYSNIALQRELSLFDRVKVRRLCCDLRKEGVIEVKGEGFNARWRLKKPPNEV